jgi:hypothetical protein
MNRSLSIKISLLLSLTAGLISCRDKDEERNKLKLRADSLISLLQSVKGNDEHKVEKIKDFIFPYPENVRYDLAKEYYRGWQPPDANYNPSSHSHGNPVSEGGSLIKSGVDNLEISGDTAFVFIASSWLMRDSTKMHYLSKTQWIKSEGKWYRSSENGVLVDATQEY